MRFQVPQFIDIEDKIFIFFTFKQAVYVVGGLGVAFVLWKLLPTSIAFLFSTPIVVFSFALAFYKVNNRPFVVVIESALSYIFSSRLYIWKKGEKEIKRKQKETPKEKRTVYVPKISESKLSDLAWSLDIKESIYSDDEQRK